MQTGQSTFFKHRLRSWLENSYIRVVIMTLLILAGYLLLMTYFVNSYTDRLDDLRKAELKRIVQIGLDEIEPYRYGESPEGSIYSPTAARQEGASRVREATRKYNLGENYLFMATYDGVYLVQPFQPEKEYTDQWNAADARGTHFIQDLSRVAQQAGGGYVEYYYPSPTSDEPQRKISYVVGIPEWNSFVGAGMYMDDIDAENRAYLRNALLLTSGLFLLIFGVIFVALRPMVTSYRTLLDLFERVSRQPDRLPPVPVERFRAGSESWELMVGFRDMLTQIERSRHAIRQEQARRAEAEQAAAAAERNRLARDLHDAVTQTLFSASLIADVLPRLWGRDPDAGRQRLDEVRQLTRGALAEMRTLLLELRPAALLAADLGELLRQLAEAVTGRARVPVELKIEGNGELPPEVKIALYRIVQEALNNMAKHAGASRATIGLQHAPDRVELWVEDDGRGFDVAGVPAGHLGLGIMRERAAAIDASLDISSQAGGGTRIIVIWERKSGAETDD